MPKTLSVKTLSVTTLSVGTLGRGTLSIGRSLRPVGGGRAEWCRKIPTPIQPRDRVGTAKNTAREGADFGGSVRAEPGEFPKGGTDQSAGGPQYWGPLVMVSIDETGA
jgi:hypothetical protein